MQGRQPQTTTSKISTFSSRKLRVTIYLFATFIFDILTLANKVVNKVLNTIDHSYFNSKIIRLTGVIPLVLTLPCHVIQIFLFKDYNSSTLLIK